MSHLEDAELCASSPGAQALAPGSTTALCGGGVPQPGWPACRNYAAWQLQGHQHRYCTPHAAKRLRAQAAMARQHQAAVERRARGGAR